MSYVQEQQKKLMIERLQNNAELLIEDINDIIHALQVASGNATGVGKIKGILQYLEQMPIHIITANGEQVIKDKFELSKFIQTLDKYIDFTIDRDFKDYF
ncbi:hypothetical protein BZG02_11345 [Labilibaculum filiforme]|uniref:Uncharacterized protein n=1 Tax=Labilibaculum filiforme TaxID=1940526 RepID=A0A2N3HXM7_9BACT|nr:hypothetical protein [Labilibaculum filiforme]PKQ62787.1 hypothetical protein BZG02_11345 [Labilibaculum filiforme]